MSTVDLRRTIVEALDRPHVPAHALGLKITESALVVDDAPARYVVTALRDLGVRLSIDDIGTGFSSPPWMKARSIATSWTGSRVR